MVATHQDGAQDLRQPRSPVRSRGRHHPPSTTAHRPMYERSAVGDLWSDHLHSRQSAAKFGIAGRSGGERERSRRSEPEAGRPSGMGSGWAGPRGTRFYLAVSATRCAHERAPGGGGPAPSPRAIKYRGFTESHGKAGPRSNVAREGTVTALARASQCFRTSVWASNARRHLRDGAGEAYTDGCALGR